MAVSFATDILPKFRPIDINCMKNRHVLLSDAAWMTDAAPAFGFPDHGNARRVQQEIDAGAMPPGHPWPKDWVALYAAWVSDGFEP